MIDNTSWTPFAAQPGDVRGVSESERDALIISATQVDGKWIILSRYGHDSWQLEGFTSNVPASKKWLDFSKVPSAFRTMMKAMMYRYLLRGRGGTKRPKGAVLVQFFSQAMPFIRYLEALKINHLGAVTPMVCATYVAACKAHRQTRRSKGKPLSQRGLEARFMAVEALHELSQYTDDPMQQHPWPETSAKKMAGLLGNKTGGQTPLIPDDVFCTLFERAYQQIECGQRLLNLRDALDVLTAQRKELRKGNSRVAIISAKNRHLDTLGWGGGLRTFNRALIDLRTACYIVLASTSGCRNHELANVQLGAHHRTQDDEGTVYHWMRSRSDKTDTGIHDWMIPEAAVRALRLMERWSAPFQAVIAAEIVKRRRVNPHDPEIAEARKHLRALFLGVDSKGGKQVRTLSNICWPSYLKAFAKDCGLSWNLTSHQFRRKFANYVAHSRFGDLRYLKEHFAHWTLDMTLGYAMDESWGQHLDLELYEDIQTELKDIKLGIVENWQGEASLAGGYGRAFKQWQREPQNLLIFKDHASMLKSIAESTAIRSNGHAWCTADNEGCVGNALERTRCGNCNHAVIGPRHAAFYQHLYDDLKGLLHCPEIGEGGRQRVERDLKRCRDVLAQLDMDPETLIA